MHDIFIDGEPLTTYQNLANAIIIQAVNDYRDALRWNDRRTQLDCERFFLSEWFMFLTPINGEHLMITLIKEIEKEHENRRAKFRNTESS